MRALAQHLDALTMVDWPTIVVIAVLCAISSLLIKEYLAHPPLIIFVYPILVVLSVVSSYVLSLLDLYNPTKLDQWLTYTVLATIVGNLAGVALVGLINSIYALLTAPARRT